MDPLKFYVALYRIGNYIEAARGCIQKEQLSAAMPHVAEISEIANRLYRALGAANSKAAQEPASKLNETAK